MGKVVLKEVQVTFPSEGQLPNEDTGGPAGQKAAPEVKRVRVWASLVARSSYGAASTSFFRTCNKDAEKYSPRYQCGIRGRKRKNEQE